MSRSERTPATAATRRAAVSFLVFAAVALAALALLRNTMVAEVDGETSRYSAVFTDVNGLRAGDDVRLAGVKVGDVASIKVDGSRAVVAFTTRTDVPLRTDTGLVMRYQNLIGQRYLALLPGKAAGTRLDPGTRIPVGRTSPGFDLTALLNGFRPLFDVLDPEDVNRLAGSIVKVLQGEGGTVRGLLEQTTRLTDYLADQEELFQRTVANLTPVLREVSGNGEALAGTLASLEELTRGLARDRAVIGRSVTDLASTLARADRIVSEVRRPLARDMDDLRRVLRLFAANRDAYARATPELAKLLGTIGRTVSYRSALNTYLCNVTVAIGDVQVPLVVPIGKSSEVCR
jgi:phospholipid/cholesterol/gamma-HCH transport system substrate-binding protein